MIMNFQRTFFLFSYHLKLTIFLTVLYGMDLFADQVNDEDISILDPSIKPWVLSLFLVPART